MNILNLFKKKEEPKKASQVLSANTEDILGVFNRTISYLTEVIKSARTEAQKQQNIINLAQVEKEELEKLAERNEGIVEKMTAIIK